MKNFLIRIIFLEPSCSCTSLLVAVIVALCIFSMLTFAGGGAVGVVSHHYRLKRKNRKTASQKTAVNKTATEQATYAEVEGDGTAEEYSHLNLPRGRPRAGGEIPTFENNSHGSSRDTGHVPQAGEDDRENDRGDVVDRGQLTQNAAYKVHKTGQTGQAGIVTRGNVAYKLPPKPLKGVNVHDYTSVEENSDQQEIQLGSNVAYFTQAKENLRQTRRSAEQSEIRVRSNLAYSQQTPAPKTPLKPPPLPKLRNGQQERVAEYLEIVAEDDTATDSANSARH